MTITLKVSENTKEKMIEYFEDKKRPKTPDYAIFQADEADTVITLYQSGKAVFQGISADIDANMWKEMERHLNPTKKVEMSNSEDKKKKEKEKIYIDPKIYNATTIGSDEVGTGDYFGPIVVTASYVNKENIKFLESLGVKDSKKLTDEKILEIVPQIIKKIPYECMILSNEEYNNKYNSDINMNKIKAIMHNKVLSLLLDEVDKPEYIIVDEFARENRYYSYLNEIPDVVRGITFITKAETKNLAVACASIISRYIFINEFEKLCDTYHLPLPKGSGPNVDEIGQEAVEKYGKEILDKIAKKNFSNTSRILKTKII